MCMGLAILNDDIFEEEVENFFALLQLPSDTPRVTLDPEQTEIEIIDDDGMSIKCAYIPSD